MYFDEEVNRVKESISDEGIYTGAAAVSSINQVFSNYDFDTAVLAASLRNSRQVREVAEAGADVSTIPFHVLEEMIDHYKTEQGVISFSDDVVEEYEGIFQ
ncbi:MAG: transaldolase family protein [Candidatus Bipolaricaulota bacterium]